MRVPEETLAAFERIYPAHGAKQWFFVACMETAIALAERGEIESPEAVLERVVREADARQDKRY